MIRIVLVVFAALALVACGSSDPESPTPAGETASATPEASSTAAPTAAGTATPHRGPGVGFYVSIEEVGLGPNGYVTIKNFTETAINIGDLYICQPPRCTRLPEAVMQPGTVGRIAVGDGAGIENVVAKNVPLQLAPSDGEVAIFGSEKVDDPAAIRAYFEWGATPHAATAVAIKAALWVEGSFAPTGERATRLYRTEANLWVWDSE
ncbi:MAG TPA: hypothetical protein VIH05_00465 [Tepidiformaceae bacterium]